MAGGGLGPGAERTPRAAPAAGPSLYDPAADRLGPLVADRLVDTLCRSVYSRPAAAVLLSDLHPTLWREFLARGSLRDAVDAVATGQRAGAAVGGIRGGMWRLPAALARAAAAHGADIRTGTAVRAVRPEPESVTVDTAGGSLSARRVVIATGPAETTRLLSGAGVSTRSARSTADGDSSSEERGDASTRGSVVAAAGVRLVAAAVAHPGLAEEPVGSGVIVDPALHTEAKALTHITAKWDWARDAAPGGIHLVRLSARDPQSSALATAADVARELSVLTGLSVSADQVVDVVVQEWPDAVVGSVPAELADGIHLAGAAIAGTGLASVIPHAHAVASDLDALFAVPPTSASSVHPTRLPRSTA